MSAPTREQFVELVRKTVLDRFPLVKLGRGEHPFSLRVNGHEVSLENLYRLALLRPDHMTHSIQRWIVELLRASEGSPDRHGTLAELRERIFPMILSASGEQSARDVVSQPLVDGLNIAYAIDSDRTIAYLPEAHFKTWGISLDEIHAIAIENLMKKSTNMNAQASQDEYGDVNLVVFQAMDGYDASRLLLPTLHDRLREHLGSPFAAGIPNRDILLCFRDNEETVSRLSAQIAEDYRQMPHQVTDKLLLITADGIARRTT